jgi:hypothetical protein
MEILIYILLGVIVILVSWVWQIGIKFRKIRKNFERFEHEMILLKGRLKQAEGIDLDISIIQDQEEENIQKLFDFIRQEIGGAKRDIRDLEERVESLEEDVEEESQQLAQIEDKIVEKEEE